MLPLPYEASLLDLVRNLEGFEIADRFEIGPTIFAVAPWTPASAAVVLAEDAIDGVAPSRPEYAYVLEVEIASPDHDDGVVGDGRPSAGDVQSPIRWGQRRTDARGLQRPLGCRRRSMIRRSVLL